MAIIVKGGGGKPEEEKTVTAGTSVIEVSPSSGKVIKKVTVNPTPTESKSITPTTSELTVTPSEGKHLSQVVVGAVEDVTPEVTAQTPIITQMAENLGVTITTPSGTNKQILQGNNANLLDIKNNAKKEGAYVWKKCEYDEVVTILLTNPSFDITSFNSNYGSGDLVVDLTPIKKFLSEIEINSFLDGFGIYDEYNNQQGQLLYKGGKLLCGTNNVTATISGTSLTLTNTGINSWVGNTGRLTLTGERTFYEYNVIGNFLDFVVSDSPTAYPDGCEQGGYWYELYGVPLNIVTWASGTDEEIVAMVEAADQGVINLSDYWAVGDIRTVQLLAMSATGVGESHAAQQVDLVLMHAGGYDLNAAVASGRTKCSFVVGLKDSLTEAGYMNSSNTNSGSWNGSARRTWCNNVFRNAIPSTLRAIFKQFKTVTAQTYNGSTNQTSVDYFALPAEREIFDAINYCNQTEYNALFQFDYYKTASNRVKKLGKTGTASGWWERSPDYGNSAAFCTVYNNGDASDNGASSTRGLAPFGCI